MTDEDALSLITELERTSRRTRPFLILGLIAIIAGFAYVSIYLYQDGKRQAELIAGLQTKSDQLTKQLGVARDSARRLQSDPGNRQAMAALTLAVGLALNEAQSLRSLGSARANPAAPGGEAPAREPGLPPVTRTALPGVVDTSVSGGSRETAGVRQVTRIIVLDTQQNDLQLELGGLRSGRVSYHYLIDRQGRVRRLKSENDVAFHTAGANEDSIGIGILHVSGEGNYTSAQIASLTTIIREIAARREIPRSRIFSNSDINSARRSDFGIVKQQILDAAF
jgi:hypothetical protein